MAFLHHVLLPFFISFLMYSVLAFRQENENLKSLMMLLSTPQKPERSVPLEFIKYPQPYTLSVTQYSWKTCGSSDPVTVNVTLSPDPLPIPGIITVSGQAILDVDIVSPVKLALSIQKKFIIWVTIPCIDNIGSCTYDDGCLLLTQAFPGDCPSPLSTYSLPCHCPFPAGNYNLPTSQATVNDTGIPEWLTSGDYKVRWEINDATGKELACYDVLVSLN